MPLTTAILNQVIFDYTLPSGALMTYLRLAALAVDYGGARVGPLDFDSGLLPRLGVKRSQAHEHLRQLRMAKLLYWETDGRGYTIYLVGVAQRPDPPLAPQVPLAPPVSPAPQVELPGPDGGDGAPFAGAEIAGAAIAEAAIAEAGFGAPLALDQDLPEAAGFQSTGAVAYSAAPDCVDGDDALSLNINKKESVDKNHQQHLPAGNPDSRSSLPPDPWSQEITRLSQDAVFTQVFAWMVQVGVWTDHAMQIARQISGNELRQEAFLPTRADVIGWIAFCFALGGKYGVKSPAHILSTNLRNKRLCPPVLLPPRICAACGRVEAGCECEEKAGFVYPDELIRLAQRNYYGQVEDFWEPCPECQAIPCRCPEE